MDLSIEVKVKKQITVVTAARVYIILNKYYQICMIIFGVIVYFLLQFFREHSLENIIFRISNIVENLSSN